MEIDYLRSRDRLFGVHPECYSPRCNSCAYAVFDKHPACIPVLTACTHVFLCMCTMVLELQSGLVMHLDAAASLVHLFIMIGQAPAGKR